MPTTLEVEFVTRRSCHLCGLRVPVVIAAGREVAERVITPLALRQALHTAAQAS